MLSVWCLVPGNYPTARRLRPLRSLIEDRTIAEKSIDLILSRYLSSRNRESSPNSSCSNTTLLYCGAYCNRMAFSAFSAPAGTSKARHHTAGCRRKFDHRCWQTRVLRQYNQLLLAAWLDAHIVRDGQERAFPNTSSASGESSPKSTRSPSVRICSRRACPGASAF